MPVSRHPVIPNYGTHGRPQIAPIGATMNHLINSLHKASMYGRRGLSSNVGNRSLPITRSSSPCARLCTCGKRTRARKSEIIEDAVSIIDVSKKMRDYGETHSL